MTTIILPADLETRISDEAGRGTTPELLAVDSLRRLFRTEPANAEDAQTLTEFLGDFVGAVEGTGEPMSEDCGRRFTDALIENQQRKRVRQQRRGP